MERQGNGRREFHDFRSLEAFLKGDLEAPLADVESRRMKTGGKNPAAPGAGLSSRMQNQVEKRRFEDARRTAWEILGLNGLHEPDEVIVLDESGLRSRVGKDNRVAASKAFTVIGLCLRHDKIEAAAIRFLEKAMWLDEANNFALRNITDMAVLANEKELGTDSTDILDELTYRRRLGVNAGELMLRNLGVTRQHILGERQFTQAHREGDVMHNITWVLTNLASLHHKTFTDRCKLENKPDAGDRRELEEERTHAEAALDLIGLPRQLDKAWIRVSKEGGGGESFTAVKALTAIGNASRSMRRDQDAAKAYIIALEIDPDRKEAKDGLKRIHGLTVRDARRWLEGLKAAPETWESLRTATLRLKPVLEPWTLPFTPEGCDAKRCLLEASTLRGDIAVLDGKPESALLYVSWAEGERDAFWGGIDAENLPAFMRVEETLRHIRSNDVYAFQKEAAERAKTALEGYGVISDSMMPKELTDDAENLRKTYSALFPKRG